MAQATGPQDLSMQEILDSIRRIIADNRRDDPTAPVIATASDAAPSDHDPHGQEPNIPARESAGRAAAPPTALPNVVSFPADAQTERARPDARPRLQREAASSPRWSQHDAADAPGRPRPATDDPKAGPEMKVSVADRAEPGEAPSAVAKGLLSAAATAAISAELQALSQAVTGPRDSGLHDLAREMLRPMLREWLDRHLPDLVRQMVRDEIERISPRNR